MAWEDESKLYAEKLERLVTGIDKILSLHGNRIITEEVQERLVHLKDSANVLLPKLKTGEFEISIVGLEKTGKSSFCNALIGISALPTDELRCTYTSTCIKPGNSSSAVVTFYGKQEFDRDLKEKLSVMGIPNSELLSIDNLSLDKYSQLFENCAEEMKDKYEDSLNRDIVDTLQYKESLNRLLGSAKKNFSSEEMRTDEFKKYITKPEYAIAVKNVMIISDELKEMPNSILFDVPGFNSPTLMHQEQTLEKMRSADAIVLIAKGEEPSLTKEVLSLLKVFKKSDIDGALLSDKLFVFGNKVDRSHNINDALSKTVSQWTSINHIMPDTETSRQRIFVGSANAHLGELSENGLECREKLERAGMNAYGINEIRSALIQYYQTTRFDVLKKRVDKIFCEFEDALSFSINIENGISSNQEYNEILLDAYIRIKDDLTKRLNSMKTIKNAEIIKNEPLKADLENRIRELITVKNYQLSDEELDLFIKEIIDIDSAPQPQKLDGIIREKRFTQMYKDYEDKALTCASDMHIKLYEDIVSGFIASVGISIGTEDSKTLSEDFEKTFLADNRFTDYYSSLIERFSRDIFEIFIKFQHGVDRLDKFKAKNAAANYFSLGVFYNATLEEEKTKINSIDSDSEKEISEKVPGYICNSPAESQLWRVLLYPDSISEHNDKETVVTKLKSFTGLKKLNPTIDNLVDKVITIKGNNAVNTITELFSDFVIGQPEITVVSLVKELLNNYISSHESEAENLLNEVWNNNKYLDDLAAKHKTYTYEMVSKEFNNDIEALQMILIKAVIPAVNLDRAFLSRQTRIIENVIRMLNEDVFRKFIARNIDIIESSNVEKLNAEKAQRDLDVAVAKEINEMKNSILTV